MRNIKHQPKKISNFAKKVYKIVAQIPRGKVLSYQEVAIYAGSPQAYRAVGNLMHHNPDPKVIPCHRVIAAGQKTGGYAFGQKSKIKKLKKEGLIIKNNKIYPVKSR